MPGRQPSKTESTSPLSAVESTSPGGSFVRKTTKLLLESANRIVRAIERDDVASVVNNVPNQPIISSNLCDAILQMQAAKENAALSISAQWAKTITEESSCELPTEVRFNPDYFEAVEDIYLRLRPSSEDSEATFAGVVETLNGDVGEDGRRSGEVILYVLHEDKILRTRVDLRDAQLLLKLMMEDRFPRIWVPSPENRDLRQLLWHRHRLVQMRTRIMNQLQALAMNEGRRWKAKLWSEQGRAELEELALAPWASRRRQELLELLDRMNPTIEELTAATEQEAKKRPEVAADDASWRGPAHGPRLRVDHWHSEPVSSWQGDWQLRGDDPQ
jgi:hypothetical protein